ncbi:NADP-dependent oxidoreductase domain [Phytophthora cinnamomi]|uniref:NADP-dependent oxidoreductase domain n=1 Tax=Phytophthora cinnamomi TaxID=4785 RepID=UPI00355ACBA5|nr:NADP-dependent oxidoreductase domain [Phytophthora cinnamomi]
MMRAICGPGTRPRLSTLRCARLHVGRATAAETEDFVQRCPYGPRAHAKLRVSEPGADAQWLSVGSRGIGSPALWAKDMPRVDTSKALLASYTSNFIQASANPAAPTKAGEKQGYVEALALNEAVEELDVPRECLVVSTLIGSNVLHPSSPQADGRLSKQHVESGVEITSRELDVETLDHVVCQIPDELALAPAKHGELLEKLKATCDALEALCSDGKVQSYGFALPGFEATSRPLEELVEKTFTPLSEQFGRFASLQLPQHVGSAIFPLPEAVLQFKKEREMLLIGDRPLETMLSSGNPFHLKTYNSMTGEDVALLLKTAFNLGIAVEKKYMEKIRPENEHLDLPPAEEVAWAHILANQHSQFDNLQVWMYVRETQIYPRLEATLKEFSKHKETEELGFAYSMAINQLLKCFTGSVELVDADRAASIMSAWKEKKGLLPSDRITTEEVAVMASLSAGMDITLLQEQLPATSSLPFNSRFSAAQLQQLAVLAQPHFTVE